MRRMRRNRKITRSLSRPISGGLSGSIVGVRGSGASGLLAAYPGASAGYSLRKIGSGPVVRLRRAIDNAEKDFTAADVAAGTAGSELLSNGDFATDTVWTKGANWTITGGQAVSDGTVSFGGISQNGVISDQADVYYIITFDIVACSDFTGAGTVIDKTAIQSFSGQWQITSTGTYSAIFRTSGTNSTFSFYTATGVTMTIDNVSCKPYTPSAAELWAANDRSQMHRQTSESAFCTTWYDQSASGNNATQPVSTAQPLLIRAGVTNTDNGKAALSFDGVDDVLVVSGDISSTASPHTILTVSDLLYDTGAYFIRRLAGLNPQAIVSGFDRLYNDGSSWRGSGGELGTAQQNLGTFSLKLNSNEGYSNGVLVEGGLAGNEITLDGSNTDIGIGGTAIGGNEITGGLQELIIYPSDQSANRNNIEANIANAFEMPHPSQDLVSAYMPEPAAAYSLRDVGGGGNVVRLRRASDNAERDFSAGDLTGSVVGTQVILNPEFDSATGWSAAGGWSISGGQAVNSGTDGNLQQGGKLTVGVNYIATIEISACSNFADARIRFGAASAYPLSDIGITSTGTHQIVFEATSTFFLLQTINSATMTVDFMGCEEYTPTGAEAWVIDGVSNTTQLFAYATTWYDQSASNEQVFPNPSISAADWSYAAGSMTYSINDGRVSMWNVTDYSQFNIAIPSLTGIESGKTYRIEFDYENCTHASGFALVFQLDGNVFTIAPSTGSGTASKDIVATVSGDVNGWFQTNGSFAWANGGIDVTGVRVTEIGNPATQATSTAQPLLIRAGVTATDNGKAALEFDGVDDVLENPLSGGDISTPITIATVFNKAGGNSKHLFDGDTLDRNSLYLNTAATGTRLYNDGAGITATSAVTADQVLVYAVSNGASSSINENGNTPVTGTIGTLALDGITIGRAGTTINYWDSTIQELIFYPSDQTANRTIIEANINNEYGIY